MDHFNSCRHTYNWARGLSPQAQKLKARAFKNASFLQPLISTIQCRTEQENGRNGGWGTRTRHAWLLAPLVSHLVEEEQCLISD